MQNETGTSAIHWVASSLHVAQTREQVLHLRAQSHPFRRIFLEWTSADEVGVSLQDVRLRTLMA